MILWTIQIYPSWYSHLNEEKSNSDAQRIKKAFTTGDYKMSYHKYKDHDYRYEDDHDDDRYDDDHDDVIVVGGVTYTETSDDVYVSASGDTITETNHGYEHDDHDDVIVVGGVTHTETSDDVYVSASGDTITETNHGYERYDTDFIMEAVSASSVSHYDLENDVMRFTTYKDIQVTGSPVDMKDFNAIIDHLVGADTLSFKGQLAADMDGSGAVDIQDAVEVLLHIWSGTQTNEFALVGASDIQSGELVMIGDVDSSLEYIDIIA